MKNTIKMIRTALLVTFISAATVAAEARYKKIEMADGNYIWLVMTPEEVEKEDAERTRLQAQQKKSSNPPKKWMVVFEMPDSDRFITFPMSDQEIQAAKRAEKLEAERIMAIQSAKRGEDAETTVTVIEMADGNTVTFTRAKNPADNHSLLSQIFNIFS